MDTNPAKILIAEDQVDLREMIALTLRLAGHEVSATENGEAALETAREISPDLIILDINMPLLNGYQVCEHLQASDQFAKIPVMLMSTIPDEQAIPASRNVGARDYLRKPFELTHLMQKVKELLSTD